MPTSCTSTRWSRILNASGREEGELTMKPRSYGPFPYSPIIRSAASPVAGRRTCRIVGRSQHRIFFAGDASGRPRPRQNSRYPDLGHSRLWQSRRRVPANGSSRSLRIRAPSRSTAICVTIRKSSRKARSATGNGWDTIRATLRRLNEAPPDEEPRSSAIRLDTIARATGKRPVGWLGAGLQETWNTLDLLAEAGCEYVADWGPNDDQPYMMNARGEKTIVSLPYSYNINDKQAFESANMTPADFQDAICRQFDTLYREGATSGRVMHIAVHPYLTGMPLSHRRARRRAEVHLQAQEGLEGDRLGNCPALSSRS